MPAETNRARRGHRFYPTAAELAAMPKLYEQDGLGKQAKVHVHYFVGGHDWWITEFSPEFPEDGLAFGYVYLHGNYSGELGYVHLPEVEKLTVGPLKFVAERDLYWSKKTVEECIAERL